MRKIILLSVFCLSASIVLAGGDIKPLNVKTGLWQVTMTTNMTGIPPISPEVMKQLTPEQRSQLEESMKARASQGPQTRTYKHCVTQKDLDKDPFSEKQESCTRTVLTSTSSRMKIRQVCMEKGMKMDTTINIEAISHESVKGSGHITATGDGHTMNGEINFSAKWLGAVCTDTK
jgi:hypothetical protein